MAVLISLLSTLTTLNIFKKTMNKPPKPNMANPATPKPITVPPVNETFKACFKLVRAACVVRTFALVATFIPI